MKKPGYLILAMMLLLSGCSEVTQSRNTSSEQVSEDIEINTRDLNQTANTEEGTQPVPESENTLTSNQEEQNLEDIIVNMRNKLKIESDYDEVTTEEVNPNSSTKYYTVNYYNSTNGNSAWFSSDVYGNLMSFGDYSENNYSNDIANAISTSEAEDIVREFVIALYGDVANDFEINENIDNNSLESTSYYFNIIRIVNDIPVDSDGISVEVSKKNGKVLGANVQTGTNYNFSDDSYFDDFQDVVSEDEGLEKYKEINNFYEAILGVDVSSGGARRTFEYRPVYSFLEKQIPIDAKTLEPVYLDSDRNEFYGADTEEAAPAEAIEPRELTPAEQEQVDNINTQSTVDQAEQKARQLTNLEGYELDFSNFSNYMGSKDYYIWVMSFTNDDSDYVYMTLLANDLSLMNFSKNSVITPNQEFSDDNQEYVDLGNNYLKSKGGLDPEDFTLTERSKNVQDGPEHKLVYVRKVNDEINLHNDRVTIVINKAEKEVSSYSKTWIFEDDFEYSDFEITKDEAFDNLVEKMGFELVYKRDYTDSSVPMKLYYQLKEPDFHYTDFLIDGISGELIDDFGKPIRTNHRINYEDIDEAKNPEIIQMLASNGIGYKGDMLNPTESVDQISLFRILASPYIYNGSSLDSSVDEIYDALEFKNILGDEERDPEKIITQRDYAKYVSRYLEYEEFAKLNDIYKDKYDDIDSDDSDYGYLLLAKEKNLIESEDDLLEPDKVIDRETALYYYYILKSNN